MHSPFCPNRASEVTLPTSALWAHLHYAVPAASFHCRRRVASECTACLDVWSEEMGKLT